MLGFIGNSADDVWRKAVSSIKDVMLVEENLQTSFRNIRGGNKVKELLHVCFTIKNPRQRIVFGHPFSPAYAIVEVFWMLAGFNDLSFLDFWNPRIRHFSDNGKRLHGAYGMRLGCQPTLVKKKLDQVYTAYKILGRYPRLRQVVLQIWDKNLDLPNPKPQSKDIPCSIMSHLMIRDGKLEWLQVMRANDLIWGTPINFIQFTMLQEIMAGWLDVDVGSYVHISDDLAVFERCFNNLNNVLPPPKVYLSSRKSN